MDYSDSQLQSLIAAEYALGSLRGPAAKRFQRLLETEPGLRLALNYWQRRLNPLVEMVEPVTPPERVWNGIHRRLFGADTSVVLSNIWNNLNFWRSFALASVMLIIGFGLGAFQAIFERPARDSDRYISVLQDQNEQPMLVARIVDKGKTLELEMLAEKKMPEHRVMQVWCVPHSGGKPISIGFIGNRTSHLEMTADEMQMLHKSKEIAISIEPVGGSRMEGPSGPVMYRGNII